MPRMNRYLGPLVLAGAMILPLIGSGCATRVSYRDEYHSDYHRWNGGEDRAYRVWLGNNHFEYREYNRLEPERQRDYWNWRHDHPGRY